MASVTPGKVRAIELLDDPYPSRHKPIKVLCVDDEERRSVYFVKVCRSKRTAAGNFSEFVFTTILKDTGTSTLDPVLVSISDSLYEAFLDKIGLEEEARARNVGIHFGTRWKSEVSPGPITTADHIEWFQPLNIFLLDVWMLNLDRRTTGNVLLERFMASSGGILKVLAADQSDCLGGVGTIVAGWEAILRCKGRAELAVVDGNGNTVPFEVVLSKARTNWIQMVAQSKAKCQRMCDHLDDVISAVPAGWIDVLGLDPSPLTKFLRERADNLDVLVNPIVFSPPEEAVSGGILLKMPEGEEE